MTNWVALPFRVVLWVVLALFNGVAAALLDGSASEFWHVVDGTKPVVALINRAPLNCLRQLWLTRGWHSGCIETVAVFVAGVVLTPLLFRRSLARRATVGALWVGVTYAMATACLAGALALPLLSMTAEGAGMSGTAVLQGIVIWGSLGGLVFAILFAPYLILGGWLLALVNRKVYFSF